MPPDSGAKPRTDDLSSSNGQHLARRILVAVLLGLIAARASAHGPDPLHPEMLWRTWSLDPLVLVPVLLAVWLYVRGLRRLRGRGALAGIVDRAGVLSFALGLVVLLVALVSPLDPLGETLLWAHMAQHALLVAAAPPLLLHGRPGIVLVWGLPDGRRPAFLRSPAWRRLARGGNALSRPLPAAALHGLALWVWHAPAAFDAALASDALHALEHASFFGTALLFWRAVLAARAPLRAAAALGAAFATLMHGGLLGALITLAPRPLFIWYVDRSVLWGWSPLEDQQLAGLLMWIPLGVVYLGVCLWLASRLVVSARVPSSSAVPPPSSGSIVANPQTRQVGNSPFFPATAEGRTTPPFASDS